MTFDVPLADDLQALGRALHEARYARVLLLRGKEAFSTSGAQRMWDDARPAQCDVLSLQSVSANPDVGELDPHFLRVAAFQPEAVVGIGGGGAMDVAKVLACGFESSSACRAYLSSPSPETIAPVPVYAVPTTAGTGSETTHFAVLYDGLQKHSLAHRALMPTQSCLLPSLTRTVPDYQRASTGLDAFCHALEALWSRSGTADSDAFALEALATTIAALPRLFGAQDENHGYLLGQMVAAAHLAGKAIDVARTTAAHALSYRISGISGCAHGHSVAVTIAACCDHVTSNLGRTDPGPNADTRRPLRARLQSVVQLFDPRQPIESLGDLVRAWMGVLPIELSLGALGLDSADATKTLVDGVNLQRLSNFPVPADPQDLAQILGASV